MFLLTNDCSTNIAYTYMYISAGFVTERNIFYLELWWNPLHL